MGALSIAATVLAFSCLCLFAVNGYEIVYPFKADSTGNKRELSTNANGEHQDVVAYVLKRDVGDMVLELKRDVGFHANKVLMRTFNDDGNLRSEMHAPESCHYSGKIADNEDSYVLLDTCEGLRGSIEDGQKRYNLEPLDASQGNGAHKLYEVENDDKDLLNRALGVDPLPEDYIEIAEEDNDAKVTENKIDYQNDEHSQSSLVPDVDPVYAKYPITKKTRYCEMFLVIDNAIYVKYNRSKKLVLSRMLKMIHAVDRSYAAVNVRLVLVAIEIWTDKNKIPYDRSGGAQLSLFNKYRRQNLLGTIRHDIAHFMSMKSWSGGVIGMAYVGGVCHTGHGTAINLWSFSSITGTNGVVGHELGHNFGFGHDGSSCKCLTTRGCFMGGPESRRPGFSDCNMKVLSDPKRNFNCLNNYPRGSLDNVCGNGIIEGSEECDCGPPELCKKKDSCCQPHNCKLKRSAQCSDFNTPDCCKNCLFKRQGTLCREARNNCDFAEYCTGRSATCPNDVYRKDGTTCSYKASVLTGNLGRSETLIAFNPPIKARHFRFNPVYWPNTWACMRMELLTCSADEDIIHVPQPISTRNLYYTSSLCLIPDSLDCADSKANETALIFKREQFGDCNKANYLFTLENDGTLRHNCSGKVVCPGSGNYLSLKNQCPDDKGKYKRLANYGLQNIKTGGCVESSGGWPMNNKKVQLRWTQNCAGGSHRTKLHFLESDCRMPAGMENGKIPDSAFTASTFHQSNPPKDARLNVGKSWCPPKHSGKNEYLQVDIGKIKTVSSMRLEGTYWNWVSGFKLLYSDDAKYWTGYSANKDLDKNSTSYCYSGTCGKSLNIQCKDLWTAGTRSADQSCWSKLNKEANGFGTCDPAKNKTCDQKDVFCGQLQCNSDQKAPKHVKYGSVYKEILINGTKCSAASITIPGSSNDQVGNGLGMVADGTKCGDGKMCSGYSCKSITELNIKKCPEVHGRECAGQGSCDNKGKCHCSRGLDPKTNCTSGLMAIDGNWGQWTSWSTCSSPCNGGTRQRSRFCDAPFPAHGGKECVGNGYQEEQCHTDACSKAKSCKLLMKKLQDSNKPMIDGVYNITMPDGSVMPMYCDMTRDGGGWTLVVAASTNTWTTSDMVREKNKDKPSLWTDYSILKFVDSIKENYDIDDDTFEYRLEAHTRGRWGGIWIAPISYKFDTLSSSQTDVKLTKKFDEWMPGSGTIANRMPHIIENWLTTQTRKDGWGSITGNNKRYHPAPWIKGELKESKPEYIWYWMREGKYKRPFSCTEIRLRALIRGHKPKSGLYQIQTSKGQIVSTFCDMDSFGGGWTMVLNKVSNTGWNKATTLSRNIDNASKSEDYSILSYAKGISSLKKQEESTFQYMIEADGHQRWGGIFEARMEDAVTVCSVDAKKPKLLKKFDNWNESNSNLAKRVPYFLDNPSSYLTTEETASIGEDGVLVSSSPSIYIKGSKEKPKFIRMWIRETASKRSCNQIKLNGQRKGVVYKNGFYIAKKSEFETRTLYCDMTSDSGGWTLLLTSAHGNWTKDQVLSRNEDLPSITDDYSILRIADSIKSMSSNASFRYKLDAHKFNRWGGIWEAPMKYTFVSKSAKQESVRLLKQFDKWDYNVWWRSVNNRMPWLGQRKGILTTSGSADYYWWGTIVSDNMEYKPAPWISWKMDNPGVIWYWINEDDCNPNREPVDGRFTQWSGWTRCSVNCGKGISIRIRKCIAPRCGGAPCDPKAPLKETKECSGKCLVSPMRNYDSNYCVLPKTGKCNVSDETVLQWKSGIDQCDLPEAQFIVDYDRGSITHKCSGKPVCPSGGKASNGRKVVINSKCPPMQLQKRFTRTMFDTLHFADRCVHPNARWPGNNVDLVMWTDCDGDRLKVLFYKTEKGPVHAKFWQTVNLASKSIADILNDTRFPNNPSSSGFLDNFDSPYSMGNSYGLQMWSYFVAPESGLYTFYSACDDVCQVFLSSTDREADKKMIIFQKGWSRQYTYDQRSDQKSKEISLVKGNLYYLEGIFVEFGGGDHLSVAVDLPSGSTLKPIPGYYLRAKG